MSWTQRWIERKISSEREIERWTAKTLNDSYSAITYVSETFKKAKNLAKDIFKFPRFFNETTTDVKLKIAPKRINAGNTQVRE